MSFTNKEHAGERGFTLLELLVAMFLAMIVLAAGYTVFQGSNRAAMQQNMDNRMQDNARVAMDVLARDARRAGFMVNFLSYPPGKLIGGSNQKIIPQNSNGAADQITIIGGTLTSLGTLQWNAAKGANMLNVSFDAVDAGLKNGDVIAIGLTYSGVVSAPVANTISLDTTQPTGMLNMAYPGVEISGGGAPSNQNPAPVRLVADTRYQVNTTNNRHPVLERVFRGTTEPVAEDIEDLQLAYGVDRNANRIIEAGEWTSAPLATEMDLIRLVRITIVARSAQPDPALLGRPQTVPAIEDRPARPNLVDGYRRYILTRVVKTRNLDALNPI